jgi:hypothetical protein
VHAETIGLGMLSQDKISVDGPFVELQTTVQPAAEDWAIKLMNHVARSPFITKHFLFNDHALYPVRIVVGLARRLVRRLSRSVAAG